MIPEKAGHSSRKEPIGPKQFPRGVNPKARPRKSIREAYGKLLEFPGRGGGRGNPAKQETTEEELCMNGLGTCRREAQGRASKSTSVESEWVADSLV